MRSPPGTQACADLGIAGVDLRGELLGLTASLPDLMDTGVGALSDPRIGEAIAYYRAMTEAVCGVQVGTCRPGDSRGAPCAALCLSSAWWCLPRAGAALAADTPAAALVLAPVPRPPDRQP